MRVDLEKGIVAVGCGISLVAGGRLRRSGVEVKGDQKEENARVSSEDG